MKYKDFFLPLIKEANLSGNSRSGGMSNWDYYVSNEFSPSNEYIIEKPSKIIDIKTNEELGEVFINDKINILSKELKNIGRSNFAFIKKISDNKKGYVNINSISKPTTQSDNSVIPGGKNSKEFGPDKLGLQNTEFSSSSQLISSVVNSIKSKYSDKKFNEIKIYLSDVLSKIGGGSVSINESFSKDYSLSKKHNVSSQDIKILSKNFGEVLGAIYTIKYNKKSKYVKFPSANQGLYDYLMVDKNDITTYFSTKSAGGSSTSMENINFVLKNFSDNKLFKDNKKEIDVIKMLINNKSEGKTTLTNIENFYKSILKTEESQILTMINKISKVKSKDLSQSELSKWFISMKKTSSEETFINTMKNIYSSVLSNSSATNSTLSEMYNMDTSDSIQNGYLYYPMGSYIVKYLNENEKYVDTLNYVLNFASYIHQFDANLSTNSFNVKIHTFDKIKFRFSYNGMAKKPANRPIGFKKV